MKSYIVWVALVGVLGAFVLGFGAIMAGEMWARDKAPYVNGLDRSLARAQVKIAGGDMLKELDIWLASYQELKIEASYEPIRARVTTLRNELLVSEESPGATLVKREKVRAQLGAIPLIGAKLFSESHSWWGYLLMGVGLVAGALSLISIGIYLATRSVSTPENVPTQVRERLSCAERSYSPYCGSIEENMVAAQVFATAMINQQGISNYESRRF